MSIAIQYQKIMDAISRDENGFRPYPFYEDVVKAMRRDATYETERNWQSGSFDPNELFEFDDGSKCVLHNPDQMSFCAFISIYE